jgi:hypothetical protein
MPVDVSNGHVNVVWQRYANEVTLRARRHTAVPPLVLNVTGPELLPVRDIATRLGRLLDREPVFAGVEAPTALLSDARRCHQLFGPPDIPVSELLERTAAWVAGGGPLLGEPTGFQRRDGRF